MSFSAAGDAGVAGVVGVPGLEPVLDSFEALISNILPSIWPSERSRAPAAARLKDNAFADSLGSSGTLPNDCLIG